MEEVKNALPQKTWFLERIGDGYIFAVEERQAATILYERSNWKRSDFRIVGVGSGQLYAKIMSEQRKLEQDLRNEIEELAKTLKRYMLTEEKLKFDDVLPDTDEKVIRVRTVIQETQTLLNKKEAELFDIVKTVKKRAFDAEFEGAKGNLEKPARADVFTPNASGVERDKILSKIP